MPWAGRDRKQKASPGATTGAAGVGEGEGRATAMFGRLTVCAPTCTPTRTPTRMPTRALTSIGCTTTCSRTHAHLHGLRAGSVKRAQLGRDRPPWHQGGGQVT